MESTLRDIDDHRDASAEDVPSPELADLARQLFEQFAQLGRNIHPNAQNFTRGEAGVIRTLHLADLAGEPTLTPTQIAERSHLSTARTANVLRALEEKGWISREHDTADRRRVTVTLTPKGESERSRRRKEMDDRAADFLGKLGAEDAHEAIRILARCNEILGQKKKDAPEPANNTERT